MNVCPYCFETISPFAKTCWNCREELPEAEKDDWQDRLDRDDNLADELYQNEREKE